MWGNARRLTPLNDHSAAAWIKERLLPFRREEGYRVGNLVPQDFDAYARVFHPPSWAERRSASRS